MQRASAGVTLVTSATELAANDSIDWGQLGPDSTVLLSSIAVTSSSGLGARVTTDDPTGLVRVDEGASWTGNFTIGDHLINNNQFSFSPLSIDFESPISGAGAQIQLDAAGPFTATIEAFSGTMVLGSFTEDGLATSLEDGAAIFIGVLDTTAEITSIVFAIDNPPAFGEISRSIHSRLISPGAVPEPTSHVLAMIAVAVGLLFWWRGAGNGTSGGFQGPPSITLFLVDSIMPRTTIFVVLAKETYPATASHAERFVHQPPLRVGCAAVDGGRIDRTVARRQ